MAGVILGPISWDMDTDDDGYRNYTLSLKVEALKTDGPVTLSATPGLPLPGSTWAYLGESDPIAVCSRRRKWSPIQKGGDGDPALTYKVDLFYSTKPYKQCQDQSFDNPLLAPPKKSGNFVKYTEEAVWDRYNNKILNSAHEQMRGAQVEFDANRQTVKIEINVATLNLALIDALMDHVNDRVLWGHFPRRIKFSGCSWTEEFYGLCYRYYKLSYDFEINWKGFDRALLDEGQKVINGHWDRATGDWVLDNIGGSPPDPSNPKHFIRFKDRQNENSRVILNGKGAPAKVIVSKAARNPDIFYVAIAPSTGQALTDRTFWIPQLGGDQMWLAGQEYKVGEIVLADIGGEEQYFIAVADNVDSQPPSANWVNLPGEGVKDQGEYDATVAYNQGDRVVEPSPGEPEESGGIWVEYYDDANLMLLGIPAVL